MKIIVDHTSMQPIYEQIVEQIKKQILQGTLREGAPLDSVRMLAKDLKVSALTVKKAYDALEEEQLIATVHGKGSFVLGVNPSLLAEEQKREIEQRMEQLVAKARAYGMSDEDLRAVILPQCAHSTTTKALMSAIISIIQAKFRLVALFIRRQTFQLFRTNRLLRQAQVWSRLCWV